MSSIYCYKRKHHFQDAYNCIIVLHTSLQLYQKMVSLSRDGGCESTSVYGRYVVLSGRPAGRGHAIETFVSLERGDQFTSGDLNSMLPYN